VEAGLYRGGERSAPEFPVSAMSRKMAGVLDALIRGCPALRDPNATCLDMGTGSGVHAFVSLRAGVPLVVGIDASKKALAHTEKRATRLIEHGVLPVNVRARLQLQVGDVQVMNRSEERRYRLMTFNPPGFLKPSVPIDDDDPLDRGVYEDCANSPHVADPHRSMAMRYLSSWAKAFLEIGGYLVITWPLIQRRLAYVAGHSNLGVPSHPLEVIASVSGWNIAPIDAVRQPSVTLFNNFAPITGYGLGASFATAMHGPAVAPFIAHDLIDWANYRFRFADLPPCSIPKSIGDSVLVLAAARLTAA
jgi:Ribosomal protein L11 methyltransferase (PrmA)